jgi:hypothetical protein
MTTYKIGDFVKVIKPRNHYCFGNVGRVLKINKASLVIKGDDNCDDNVIIISKKYVKLQKRSVLEMSMIPLTKSGNKKRGLDYYMKKAFLPQDFEDLVLFNFMKTDMYKSKVVKDEYIQITRSELLTKKIREKKIQSSEYKSCVFFTAIPTKFFKKYFSEALIANYSKEDTDVFICLDSKVLCSIPKNYWIGFNNKWSGGPTSLIWDETYNTNIFYAIDKCDDKLEMTKSFLEFFMEQIDIVFKNLYLPMLNSDIGLILYLDEKQEDKFINFLRKKGAELFIEMELFACPANWMDKVKTTLRFKKEDVLIANYERSTVEENINRVLGL